MKHFYAPNTPASVALWTTSKSLIRLLVSGLLLLCLILFVSSCAKTTRPDPPAPTALTQATQEPSRSLGEINDNDELLEYAREVTMLLQLCNKDKFLIAAPQDKSWLDDVLKRSQTSGNSPAGGEMLVRAPIPN